LLKLNFEVALSLNPAGKSILQETLFQPWTVRHGNVLQGRHPTLVNRTTFPDHFRLRSPQVEQDDILLARMRLTTKSVILTRDDKKDRLN
jgi:hypothetical protein